MAVALPPPIDPLGLKTANQGLGFPLDGIIIRKKGRRPKPAPPVLVRYIFPFSHLLVVAFHFMPAFSQSALVAGVAPANAGAVNATARPRATIIETRFFIGRLLHWWHSLVALLILV